MKTIAFSFPLPLGLHARPASLLQETCLALPADIHFRNQRNRRRADAKSVLALVASDTRGGDPCRLEVSGADAERSARVLRNFLDTVLPHADDDTEPLAGPPQEGAGWLPPVFRQGAALICPGRTLAAGIGRGRVLRLQKTRTLPRRFASAKRDARQELRSFRNACREVAADLQKKAAAGNDRNAAGILKAHLAILADPLFQERICELIATRKRSAGEAIGETTAHFARVLQRSRSAYLRERVGDLEDLASQLGETLYGRPLPKPGRSLDAPGVVVAAALSPSQLLGLDRGFLRGLVLGDIGVTSHTAILARSFAIPAVSLPPAALARFHDGAEVIVDGRRGLACGGPGPALKRYYRLEEMQLRRRSRRLARLAKEPAATRDGRRLEIAANIGSAAELDLAWSSGAEGIGLFRSEFLFLDRETPPGEEEQYLAYARAVRSAKGRPVIIRTLDIGGDKPLPYLPLPAEANPFLGYRAVRFYSEQRELIQCQLRALLRAARHGRLRIMVPMVAATPEVRRVRLLLAASAAQLPERKAVAARPLEIGIMIETPAAALTVDRLAREADFLSIGSNDLLQYVMAADRNNDKLADLYDPLQPAFLRLLLQVAAQAAQAGRWLGMCGEMAGNPEFLPLLVGLGLDELSMAPALIPACKERLAQLDSGACRDLLQRAAGCAEAAEVSALLAEFNRRPFVAAAGEVISSSLVRLNSSCRTPVEAIKELCDLLELEGRLSDSPALEEAVWKREQTFATDLGFGFALPHGRSAAVRAASVAFLRPVRPLAWSRGGNPKVRGVLLIAVPAGAEGDEHLKIIARLSRRLMHEEFRAALLSAQDAETVMAALASPSAGPGRAGNAKASQ